MGLSNCLLCTFLSLSTEKYQKNATKGLGALWTPVFPIWVCLTEDIHGGGFEKRLRKSQRRRFSHAPPNSTPSRCAAIVAVAASLPRRARPVIRQTPYLPAEKKGEFRTNGAPPSVRVIGSWRPYAQSDSFAPLWARESRGSGGGFLKGGTVGDSLEGRSFGPFLSPWRERDISLSADR